jgi:hypothetical protein
LAIHQAEDFQAVEQLIDERTRLAAMNLPLVRWLEW